ncbi:MBL fold metallo-hydrolase [Desulfomicrobium salsuginis]
MSDHKPSRLIPSRPGLIPVHMLGQAGCRLDFPDATIYIDPYLSNSAQELDAPDLVRQLPIPYPPETICDADWILITHDHIDHCDPHTLPKLAKASPQALFVGPASVLAKLRDWGITDDRIFLAKEAWFNLTSHLRLHAIPAAHPDINRDMEGNLSCVGYLLEFSGQRIYFAGDTSVCQEILDALNALQPIHTAFLPVNEHNFFKGQRNIVGNMSVRDAMHLAQEIGVKQLVPIHWDMFPCNAVSEDEILLVYRQFRTSFRLALNPRRLSLTENNVSIIIRTLNESRYLGELLMAIENQSCPGLRPEVIVVDSGSTDGTLTIAHRHGCRVQTIDRSEFSFGRSLNRGCSSAQGEILVIISGHCVPSDTHWLSRLCEPLYDGLADYVYGGQAGGSGSRWSEHRIFAKYFPNFSRIPTGEFYCNNANSAITREAWAKYGFDEDLTGLEDMELAQRLLRDGGRIGYVAEAQVIHHHCETWSAVRRRFEREAIALQRIMPQVHVGALDMIRYFFTSIAKDMGAALAQGELRTNCLDVVAYRWNQYLGTYLGNRELRKLSHAEKEKYFYPV